MKITKQNRNKAKYKPSEHTIEGSEFNTYGTGLSTVATLRTAGTICPKSSIIGQFTNSTRLFLQVKLEGRSVVIAELLSAGLKSAKTRN